MEYYGIVSEGELMSGQIVSIKNRISEKEADDMNLFNTNMVSLNLVEICSIKHTLQVIEDKVKREITAARIAFFKPVWVFKTYLNFPVINAFLKLNGFFQLINWEDELEPVQNKRRDIDEVRISSMDQSIESLLL